MKAVFAGSDTEGLADELRERGATVGIVDGVANRPALEDAGVHDADVFVLTDVGQATSIVVARDLNPDIRVVAYTPDSLPEFVSGQQVLAMDPALFDADTVAEELTAPGDAEE
jgi:Trk K+ transport system NAD-binding subunit